MEHDKPHSHTKEMFANLEQVRNSLEILHSATADVSKNESLAARAAAREHEEQRLERAVRLLVSCLPSDRWAAAVHGRYLCGQSAEVVARNMGVSRSSVYGYLSCATTWADDHLEQWESAL